MIRALMLCGVLALAGGVIGCSLFGITTGEDGKPVSDGTGGPVGTALGFLWPWATTAIATGAGLYANVKRAGWKATAVSTASSVEEWKRSHPDQWNDLKKLLMDKHERAKVQKYIDILTAKK